jgi:hypothetical protein
MVGCVYYLVLLFGGYLSVLILVVLLHLWIYGRYGGAARKVSRLLLIDAELICRYLEHMLRKLPN